MKWGRGRVEWGKTKAKMWHREKGLRGSDKQQHSRKDAA
jgi:hypothetical protein